MSNLRENRSSSLSDDEIAGLYERLIAAWNARDARAFADLFMLDGSVVGFDGSQMDGRSVIAAQLKEIFEHHQTAPYVTIIRETRMLAPGVWLLRAVAGMTRANSREINPAVNTIQSLVAVVEGNDWRIVLFQNTPAAFHGRPEDLAALTAEIQRAVDA